MGAANFRLFTDGGARGNPGSAGISFVLYDPKGLILEQGQKFIGRSTNNVAEYSALILGLEKSLENKIARLDCFSDSELVVRQMVGEYRVKDLNLRELFLKAKSLLPEFEAISFTSIPRGQNRLADKLVNEVIDRALK